MSAPFISTLTAWESQADYYTGLNLDCSDRMFGTDMQGTRMYVPDGINYCSLSTTMNLKDGEEREKTPISKYANLYNNNMIALNKQVEPYLPDFETYVPNQTTETTVVNVLLHHPRCKKWLHLCNKAGWLQYLYRGPWVSMFIPVDDTMTDEVYKNLLELPMYMLRALMQAHTMNYTLDPSLLVQRKTQCMTVLPSYTPIVDGRNPERITIYENDYNLNNGVEYAPLIHRSVILEQIVTSRGTALLLSDVLRPTVIMS